jgi:Mg-chelatase subunit ChlD
MASIEAPSLPEDGSAKRPPLEIVAVVDRSGSMRSENKMTLMKDTLKLLVTRGGLTSRDKFGLVSFDNVVKNEISLVAPQRDTALAKIKGLQPGGTTNLSGGLLKGIDMLKQSYLAERERESDTKKNKQEDAGASGLGVTRAVLMFTDGVANVGITDAPKMREACRAAIGDSRALVFTFGFGADHNEDLLQDLAESNGGSYYFVKDAEAIPKAFADCLGGLQSVVGQNAELSLEPWTANDAPPCTVESVLGNAYPLQPKGDGTESVVVALGDLYEEDAKDVLLRVKLGACPGAKPFTEARPLIRATLRYFCVTHSKFVTASASLSVARPDATPEGQKVPTRLAEHMARLRAAQAMAQATRLADAGHVKEGRLQLEKELALMKKLNALETELGAAIIADMNRCVDGFKSRDDYRTRGSKMTKMMYQAQMQQKSNHMNTFYKGGGKKKGRMRASWGV